MNHIWRPLVEKAGCTEQARLVERAKIILACLDGKRNDEVSRELGVRPNTVGVWRKRFAARGIAGGA